MMFWFLLFTTDKNKYMYRQRKNWDSKCSKSIEKIKSMKQSSNKRTANKKEKKKRLKESEGSWVLERLSVANFCWGANIPMASEDLSDITNNYKKKDICNVVGNVANIRQRNL